MIANQEQVYCLTCNCLGHKHQAVDIMTTGFYLIKIPMALNCTRCSEKVWLQAKASKMKV